MTKPGGPQAQRTSGGGGGLQLPSPISKGRSKVPTKTNGVALKRASQPLLPDYVVARHSGKAVPLCLLIVSMLWLSYLLKDAKYSY